MPRHHARFMLRRIEIRVCDLSKRATEACSDGPQRNRYRAWIPPGRTEMPLYFFHLSTPGAYSHDDLGIEYADVETAYLGAYQAALDIGLELLRERTDPSRHVFEIMDQDGQMLFELPFSEVLHPLNAARPPPRGGRCMPASRPISGAPERRRPISGRVAQTRVPCWPPRRRCLSARELMVA
jgi:hypothetical protein